MKNSENLYDYERWYLIRAIAKVRQYKTKKSREKWKEYLNERYLEDKKSPAERRYDNFHKHKNPELISSFYEVLDSQKDLEEMEELFWNKIENIADLVLLWNDITEKAEESNSLEFAFKLYKVFDHFFVKLVDNNKFKETEILFYFGDIYDLFYH